MFAIIICLKLWDKSFKGKKIQMYCDNQAICQVVNSGKSKCPILQDCLREIAFLAASYEFQVRMIHLSSESNRIADHLSRWDIDISHQQKFFELVDPSKVTNYEVLTECFEFSHTW